MTLDEFLHVTVARAFAGFDREPPPNDIAAAHRAATDLFERGWTVTDTVAMLRCMEEVNPDLAEDIALARMATIRTRVEGPYDPSQCPRPHGR